MTGVFAVALMLFGTKWGAYVGYAPIFLTDLLIVAALAFRVFGNDSRTRPRQIISGTRASPGPLIALFLGYMAFRSVLTPHVFTMDWIRDLMPFLYAALAFISASAYATSSEPERRKTMRILWWALNGHLAWTLVVRLGVIDPQSMPQFPGAPIHVFETRPDVDMAVLGITAALYLHRVIVRRHRLASLIGLAAVLIASSGFGTRAGLIAVICALGVSYVATLAATRKPSRRLLWTMATPILIVLALIPVSQTEGGARLLATVGVVSADSATQQSALGTANARELAWTRIIDWTNETPERALFGSGFGNNFLAESDAEALLSGTAYEGVRSPHNWLVGVYARTGLIGVGISTAILLAGIWRLWRNRKILGSSELGILASAGFVAIIPIAMLGVVLESPFGAVPFWWFAGIIFAENRLKPRLQAPKQQKTRLTQ